jgi:hypothetical protein
LTALVSAIAIVVFCLTWWMACYLVGRDPARPALQRAAAALATYAVAVAAWAIAPGSAAAQVLLCVPALVWAGAAIGLIPPDVPERRQIDRGWMILSVIFLAMIVALPAAGKVVALAPLIGALALLWRAREVIHPPVLAPAVSVVAGLYAAGLIVILSPIDLAQPVLVLAAIGLDMIVLGYVVAVADAVEAGERLHPDLRRSAVGAVAATLLCGGPAALTTLAAPGVRAVVVLEFVVMAVVMTAAGLTGPIRRLLDRLAFLHDDRLRLDRAALHLSAEALPRRRERHRLLTVNEDDFVRLTRRALDDFDDLGRLLRSPLIDLPTVDRRLQGSAAEQPLARAVELRAVLQESVARLKPDGLFGTTEEWRHYNALYFGCVRGLRPYDRQPQTDGLDRDARRAFDWFRRYVPKRTLRQWQNEGAQMVADRLWGELMRTDPRWLTRAAKAKRASATRSA